jgi:quercetin dioxygenase-like cupin family protein
MVNIYKTTLEKEISHNGIGEILKARVFSGNDFETNIDFIDYVEIPPNKSIGYHTHNLNEEIYVILDGQGYMSIDGIERTVCKGDILVNKVNGSHGLINNTKEKLNIFIFQVSK